MLVLGENASYIYLVFEYEMLLHFSSKEFHDNVRVERLVTAWVMFRVSFTAEVRFKVTVGVSIRVTVNLGSTIGSGSRYRSGS